MTSNRFVILHHLAPTGEHWDLMLENGASLATWQLASQPVDRTSPPAPRLGSAAEDALHPTPSNTDSPPRSGSPPIECTRIGDHRKRYLDYEGPVSGGRGVVTRVDQGRFELLSAADDEWLLDFHGQHLTGHYRLTRTDSASPSAWILAPT